MATDLNNDLEAFHRFVSEQLSHGHRDLSPEKCLELWRSQQRERAETIAAIRQGLEDIQAGRVLSLGEFDQAFRTKYYIPQDT